MISLREEGESMELIIDSVSKQYGTGIWGLRDFSLSLQPGILGLVGPNGAGKSTLMRILATITKPTSGKIIFNGIDLLQDPNRIREVLGYVPQDFGIYPNLNAVEFLEYLAAVKGLNGRSASQRIDELLQVVNLSQVRKHLLGSYSGGMKQRIGIAQALLNDPRLLIVDEPTVGLDPEERIRFRNLLSDLSGDRIVILSTHIVSDVEASATRIAVIRKGRLLLDAMPEELLQELEGKVWEWIVPSEDLPSIKQRYAISGTVRHRDGVEVRVISASSPDGHARLTAPRLEDAYLHLIAENGKGESP
jgi:ABC-type multidrug transport system ATPase subunit